MRTIQEWLSEYGESHQNETNKLIHWICVPAIFLSIVGLFYGIKLPFLVLGMQLNISMILAALVVIYYAGLSRTIWIGMLVFILFCLCICNLVERSGILPVWLFSIIVFVLAWI